ncbi:MULTISPECIES: hypothetical protein [Leptolyngbya]|uniref:hypothetical protein n=1 Tax=Leptolyngbya TaxID=47251 RepID=UPI0016871BAA|nr:hypothetical protein [Leptolyngbya sp. FACHB-1624]MBD1859285.1 hypothetical protein [Leptolyngbya sp. FACHB-1624]
MVQNLLRSRYRNSIVSPKSRSEQFLSKQLELAELWALPTIAPILTLTVEPINSEFEGDRYCLRYGTFTLRLELPKDQARELFDRTVRLDWTLDDRGVPTDIDRIWAAAQQAIGGGLD